MVERKRIHEANVLKHLSGAVSSEGIGVREDREQDGHRVRAHAAKRVLCCGPNPPLLVGQKTGDGGTCGSAENMSRCAGCVHAHEPGGIVQSCESRRAYLVATTRSECFHGRGSNIRIRIPGERNEIFMTELRVGVEQGRRPEADNRIRVAQKWDEPRSRRRRQTLELGGDPGSRRASVSKGCDQDLDRPFVSEVAQAADSGAGDPRVGVCESGMEKLWRGHMVGAGETRERDNATPPSPFGAWLPMGASDQSSCFTRVELIGLPSLDSPVVAQATEDDCKRQGYPGREREREHQDRDTENERVHS